MRQTTLCFLIKKDKVLLAMKKRGFGAGKWNGVGGKVGESESLERAAVRETEEEVGVKVRESDMEKKAVLAFEFDGKSEWNQECHVFLVRTWEGMPAESEEMRPQWFGKAELPLQSMWIDDPLWLPHVLKGNSLEATFLFSEDGSALLSHTIRPSPVV